MRLMYRFYGNTNTMKILHRTNLCKSYSNANVLGIETSCDDTGCAVVNNTGKLLGQSLHSQHPIHIRYGGVNPIIAGELHRSNIELAVNECLEKSSLHIKNIDAVAVTTKPGLLMSLQVGVKYAKYLARKHDKPIIPIHHMEAHSLVARMYQAIPFPFIVLLISGGHCLLAVAKDFNNFLLLGESLDNAPGEILDKAARRMKLKNIPAYAQIAGGRSVELAASKATKAHLFHFPLPLAKHRDCNFSFSGLKDALMRVILKKETEQGIMGDEIIPEINDICAAFQLAIAEHIAHRTERAVLFCEKMGLITGQNKKVVVSGGVACNDFIFKSIGIIGQKYGYDVIRPPQSICTDNGVMIAWNGIEKLRNQCDIVADISLKDISPESPLGKNIIDEVKLANIKLKVSRLKNIC